MMRLALFDLDGTVINSDHRTPNNPDGSVNLEQYFARKTRQNIFKDTLLPLANVMREAFRANYFVGIVTARDMGKDDYDFLAHHGLYFHYMIGRHRFRERLPIEPTPAELWEAAQAWMKKEKGEIEFLPQYFNNDADYKVAALRKLFGKPHLAPLPKIMYEDAPKTIAAVREALRIEVVDAKEWNANYRAKAA